MDLTFKTESGKFNYRVGAVIINDHKLLAMQDERSPYYYLPGGRVKMNETAEDAVIRELKEELEIDAKIIRPLWLNQGFFEEDVSHVRYHELCLYFLMDISGTSILEKGNTFSLHESGKVNKFEWLPFESLADQYLYPEFIKKDIVNLPSSLILRTEYE